MKSTSANGHNQALGARGEALAAEFIEALGFRVIDRNWRNRFGELDIVARHGAAIVAVEVKTRSGEGYGSPLEAITAKKSARLRGLLLDWVRANAAHPQSLRVDAIGIVLRPGADPVIEHLQGIS